MILLDKPLISDFVKDTIRQKQLKAFDSGNMLPEGELSTLSEAEAIKMLEREPGRRVHTISENALTWIENSLSFTRLPEKIELFKNKYKFRELTQDLFPELFYQEVKTADLAHLDIDEFPFPFIIKPNIGFFSMGVYKVNDQSSWEPIKKKILAEVDHIQKVYPKSVLDTASFIVEEVIEGDEYAIDAYFDENGKGVIVGVMKHYFGGADDVSDRVYTTSASIVGEHMNIFNEFINQIGKRAGLRNFSIHVEIRINDAGLPVPIEVNPLRFGAWCTSADLMHYAFEYNPYQYYIDAIQPDWEQIFTHSDEHLYSIIILDNTTGYTPDQIKSFDYDKLLDRFENVLELRKIDYRKYPMFAILFVSTRPDNFQEVEEILHSNLREFVKI